MNIFKHFDRYLGRTVFIGTLFALLVLFSIDSIIDFINDVESIDDRGFTIGHVMLRLLFEMPRRLYEFMPTALLLGALIGLGGLAAKSELVAFRSVGISKLRIILSVLKVGVVLVGISVWVGEMVVPTAQGYVNSLSKSQVRDAKNGKEEIGDIKKISLRSKYGIWVRDNDRYINAQEIYPDYRMRDIWIYELDEQYILKRASFAKQAVYEDGVWRLSEIKHSLISKSGVETVAAAEEYWERLVSIELFDVITVKPEFMGAIKLKKYIAYLENNELDSKRYQLAYFNRFAVPLSGLAMLLLALPFVFRSARAGGLGQRVALGIVVAVVFNLLSRVSSNTSVVYDIPPVVGAFLPTLIVIAIAIIALRKMA
ncbi:MAG: LPS export ABC transporter permease LptG [Nitrosomonadaceae bacterium]|nr:LPS export ABC transporter permease LptG [Nitrosomonadaceae bacterium]